MDTDRGSQIDVLTMSKPQSSGCPARGAQVLRADIYDDEDFVPQTFGFHLPTEAADALARCAAGKGAGLTGGAFDFF